MGRKTETQSPSLAGETITGPFFSRVVGQKVICSYLKKAIGHQRLAHAYLFTGSPGVGKDAVALDFATALLCDKFETSPEEAPCRTCPQCLLAARLQHPDLHITVPRPGKTSQSRMDNEQQDGITESVDKKFLEALKKKSVDHYYPVLLPRAKDILIEHIRLLINQASRMPYQAKRKVFVIFYADKMNLNAQNAFLKILEEPPEDTHLLLMAEREGALLETIRSRCQHLIFQPLAAKDIEAELRVRQPDIGDAAPLISQLSGGSLRQALELTQMDWNALQELVVNFLAACANRNPIELAAIFKELLPDDYSNDYGEVHLTLGTLQLFLRDVATLQTARRAGKSTSLQLILSSVKDRAEKLLDAFPDANSELALRAVQTARDHLDRLYTPINILTKLSYQLSHALGRKRKSQRAA